MRGSSISHNPKHDFGGGISFGDHWCGRGVSCYFTPFWPLFFHWLGVTRAASDTPPSLFLADTGFRALFNILHVNAKRGD